MASEPGIEIDWAWLRRLEPKFGPQGLMNSLPIRDRSGNQLLTYPVFNMAAKPGIEVNWQWLGGLSQSVT